MSVKPRDRRASERRPCSRSIWWRRRADDLFEPGWLVDESASGAAFLTRTAGVIRPGEQIQAMVERAGEGDASSERAASRGVIRRVQPVQSGVTLVAVQLFTGSSDVVTRSVRAAASPASPSLHLRTAS
jgi:hypothetical protein